MAVVLSSEENSYFAQSSLRRSHSQPKFSNKRGGFHTSASTSRFNDVYPASSKHFSSSPTSSAPSSPVLASKESAGFSSRLANNFSLGSDSESDDSFQNEPKIHLVVPQYDDMSYLNEDEDLEPMPSPRTGHSYTASPNEQDVSTSTSRPESPDLQERAEDDIALKAQPSRHVDYLTHNWREEDIWSSWKLIVSRRGDYTNSARLENASWRTWMRTKNKLGTVSPETLNWLKECDVTWLYGPLQTGSANLNNAGTDSSSRRLSQSSSFVKKPILKKRSMSELMLQRSLSTSSLVKQAAAAVQAQQKGGLKRIGRRPGIGRANTDYITFPFSSRGVSHDNTSLFPSAVSSGVMSPNGEKKHIHFNEQVEQCIALDVKGDDDDDEPATFNYGSDSDDAIMIKTRKPRKRRPTMRRATSSNTKTESKTIAPLPSTKLKYRNDTPEPIETAMKHSVHRSPLISPSASQETLKPSKKSGKLFIGSDDESDNDSDDNSDDNSDELTMGRSASSSIGSKGGLGGLQRSTSSSSIGSKGGLGGLQRSTSSSNISSKGGLGGLQRSSSSNSLTGPAGVPTGMLKRTPSGMLMPFDGDDSGGAGEKGVLGRVIETVNTTRDILYVIWNVGWRS